MKKTWLKNLNKKFWFGIGVAALASASLTMACGKSDTDASSTDGIAGKAEAWNDANNPAFVDKNFVYEALKLPLTGELAKPPIPSDYWATANDSINYRWDGADSLSPAEKVEKALNKPGFSKGITEQFGIYGMERKACNKKEDCADLQDDSECVTPRGVTGDKVGRCIPYWWGLCHGWAPYAFSEAAPVKPVVRNGVTFYPGDLEALMSLAYSEGLPSMFLSERCNGSIKDLGKDNMGRIRDGECRDMNAGSFHVLTANFLGIRKIGYVEDRTIDAEVWNQPVRSYKITNAKDNKLLEVTMEEAAKLVDGSAKYTYNDKAKRFFYVEMELAFIAESDPGRESRVAAADEFTERNNYKYVLEADADGKIIGGEWVGESKLEHPDFVWWPTGKPAGKLPAGLTYDEIKALHDEAIEKQ